jgi:hypothetical protein
VSEFLVEAYVSRAEGHATVPLVEDLALAAKQLSDEGADVRFLRAILVPEDEVCFYLYRSPSVEVVRAAATRAGLRFERITAAVSSAWSTETGERERQTVLGETKQ